MKCMRCGAELDGGMRFCNACGAPVPPVVPPPMGVPQNVAPMGVPPVVPPPMEEPRNPGDSTGNIFAISSIVSAVIWILITLIHVYLYRYCQSEFRYPKYSGSWPTSYLFALNFLANLKGICSIACVSTGCIALSRRCWLGIAGSALIVFFYIVAALLYIAK